MNTLNKEKNIEFPITNWNSESNSLFIRINPWKISNQQSRTTILHNNRPFTEKNNLQNDKQTIHFLRTFTYQSSIIRKTLTEKLEIWNLIAPQLPQSTWRGFTSAFIYQSQESLSLWQNNALLNDGR